MTLSIRIRPAYLTSAETTRHFLDYLLDVNQREKKLTNELIPSKSLFSLNNIAQLYLQDQRSIFLGTVAEIGSLCSDQNYGSICFLIEFLDELIKLRDEEKYRNLIENYLQEIVYADLTDHFLSYPMIIQIQLMDMIEKNDFLHFPLIKNDSESDQAKIILFLQDATRYFHNVASRKIYRQLVFRLNDQIESQQAIFSALMIGGIFLPVTCHSAFLTEFYSLLIKEPNLLSPNNMEIFFHVLWPTGINQVFSVPRVYLSQLLIARLLNFEQFFYQILQICFIIHLRVPQIRVNLIDIIEPLSEKEGFQDYLDEQQREFDQSREYNPQDVSILEPLFYQVRERLRRGFRLKQLCRMKIRSILTETGRRDIFHVVRQLEELSEKNQNYLIYNLNSLLNEPERFYESTRARNEPVWNSNIPPPPSLNEQNEII